MMVTPAHRAVTPEHVAELVGVDRQRDHRVHAPSHERRRRLVHEDHGGFVGQRVGVVRGVVGEQPRRRLAVEPLPRQARIAAGLGGHVVRGEWAGTGHRPVVAQFVPQPDGEAQRSPGHVPGELADQLLDPSFVDGHEQTPSSPGGTTPAGPADRARLRKNRRSGKTGR